MLVVTGEPEEGEREISGMAVKMVFVLFAGVFAYSLYHTIQ